MLSTLNKSHFFYYILYFSFIFFIRYFIKINTYFYITFNLILRNIPHSILTIFGAISLQYLKLFYYFVSSLNCRGRKRRSEARLLDLLLNSSSEDDVGDPLELNYEDLYRQKR